MTQTKTKTWPTQCGGAFHNAALICLLIERANEPQSHHKGKNLARFVLGLAYKHFKMRDAAKAGIMESLQAAILKVFVDVHTHLRAAFVMC